MTAEYIICQVEKQHLYESIIKSPLGEVGVFSSYFTENIVENNLSNKLKQK